MSETVNAPAIPRTTGRCIVAFLGTLDDAIAATADRQKCYKAQALAVVALAIFANQRGAGGTIRKCR